MNEPENDAPNPADPHCPTCGGTDWFSDPRWNYALHAVHADTGLAIETSAGVPWVFPFVGFTCRVCRTLRLVQAAGSLDPREASDYPA